MIFYFYNYGLTNVLFGVVITSYQIKKDVIMPTIPMEFVQHSKCLT